MLDKTVELLSRIEPGTYIPDNEKPYDEEELDQLGRILSRLVYSPSSIRRHLQDKHGVTITRSDFYSEIPTILELEQAFKAPSLLTLDGVFPQNSDMLKELARLMEYSGEFNPPKTTEKEGEYSWESGAFGYSDAMSYYTMIRSRKPKTIIEIGSGWSTLVAKMALERNGSGRIICVEPYPMDFLKALSDVEVVERRAQDVPTEFFESRLVHGDILFIDSMHTIKHDSDCLHIYLRFLPGISSDIIVHVHDIMLPSTHKLGMMRDNQIFWNEQYLLYAYLLMNPRTRPIYGSQYNLERNANQLRSFMHNRAPAGGASFWFEQRGA